MRVDNSTGKGTSSMDKFSSKVHRVHMELGGKLLYSLRIKTQFLERLQGVSVVDSAAHTQKDDVESNGGSLENVAKVFVLFLCGVQLVPRSGVLTVLDLDEVDVAPWFAEVFRSLLSGVGGSTGGWRCCWGAPSLPQFPPATSKTHPPTLVCVFCVFAVARAVNIVVCAMHVQCMNRELSKHMSYRCRHESVARISGHEFLAQST